MESILSTICTYAPEAHWILFILLLLAGLNIPLSEDLIIITAGVLSATCIPEHTGKLYVWLYMGALLSAWEAYWIGRVLGPKLYTIRWFARFITPARIDKLHGYIDRFGIFAFIVGRFFPGGIRNGLFMSCGLGGMPFKTFILRDSFACLISTSLLFFLGLLFGEHYRDLLHLVKKWDLFLLCLIFTGVLVYFGYYYLRKRKII